MLRHGSVSTSYHTIPKSQTGGHLGEPDNTTKYQAIIVSLIYAAVRIKPDIAYPTTFLAQFAYQPGPEYWVAAKQVLYYVTGTMNFTSPILKQLSPQ